MKGKKTGGRQKGSLNKTTISVKEALIAAFDGIGGVDAFIKWGKGNPQLFYPIWSKMLPMAVSGEFSFELADRVKLARERGRPELRALDPPHSAVAVTASPSKATPATPATQASGQSEESEPHYEIIEREGRKRQIIEREGKTRQIDGFAEAELRAEMRERSRPRHPGFDEE